MPRIKAVKTWVENLDLQRPYTIATGTIDQVENCFVRLETDGGEEGLGAGSPSPRVTGETISAAADALGQVEQMLLGEDLRHLAVLLRRLEEELASTPAARAAADIALHDLAARCLGLPLVELFGRAHRRLPTSITIGIKSPDEAVQEAREYAARGFRILKVKTGLSVERDLETLERLRREVGEMRIRVDANQGYRVEEASAFWQRAADWVELVEQPLAVGQEAAMQRLPDGLRRLAAADESLHGPADAIRLAAAPQAFGIYNIKLMKCGGVAAGLEIARVAQRAGIELMWGCMDESLVSITAALHAALASPATRYLDLDGSLDLARDVAAGGFVLEDGYLSLSQRPGLGLTGLED